MSVINNSSLMSRLQRVDHFEGSSSPLQEDSSRRVDLLTSEIALLSINSQVFSSTGEDSIGDDSPLAVISSPSKQFDQSFEKFRAKLEDDIQMSLQSHLGQLPSEWNLLLLQLSEKISENAPQNSLNKNFLDSLMTFKALTRSELSFLVQRLDLLRPYVSDSAQRLILAHVLKTFSEQGFDQFKEVIVSKIDTICLDESQRGEWIYTFLTSYQIPVNLFCEIFSKIPDHEKSLSVEDLKIAARFDYQMIRASNSDPSMFKKLIAMRRQTLSLQSALHVQIPRDNIFTKAILNVYSDFLKPSDYDAFSKAVANHASTIATKPMRDSNGRLVRQLDPILYERSVKQIIYGFYQFKEAFLEYCQCKSRDVKISDYCSVLQTKELIKRFDITDPGVVFNRTGMVMDLLEKFSESERKQYFFHFVSQSLALSEPDDFFREFMSLTSEVNDPLYLLKILRICSHYSSQIEMSSCLDYFYRVFESFVQHRDPHFKGNVYTYISRNMNKQERLDFFETVLTDLLRQAHVRDDHSLLDGDIE